MIYLKKVLEMAHRQQWLETTQKRETLGSCDEVCCGALFRKQTSLTNRAATRPQS